jgi:hypothetical protein
MITANIKFEINVMKKMNRSQSSYRQCKTLINEDDDSWVGKFPPRQQVPKQSANLVNSFLDANKENNSLYQSIS